VSAVTERQTVPLGQEVSSRPAQLLPQKVSPEALFERVSPSVVRIETTDDFGQPAGIGSGSSGMLTSSM
jgi:hypothetical protein